MDKNSAAKLQKVHPELRARITQLIALLSNLGMTVVVTDGLRTFDEQNKLYAKGRTAPGQRVTNARGGQSNHNFGLAVDLCPFENGKLNYDNLQNFATIGREAKKLGLEWGGDWKFTDRPHVQLKGMSVKECLAEYNKGGIEAVWLKMNQLMKGAKPAVFVPAEDDILELGDIGGAVRKLQSDLASLGFLRAHEIDGDFGKITKNAVIGFQRQNNLTADGIVGPGTKAKLAQKISEKNSFANLHESEIKLEIPKIIQKVSAAEPAKDVQAVFETASADIENLSANIPVKFPPPFTDSVKQVEEKVSQTLETAKGTVEKTTTLTENVFDAKNIPAFIPRFGKQWLFGLIPGAGFVSTLLAYVQNAPQWLIFLLGALTGIALWNFGQLVIKHREKVLEFIRFCYQANADPNLHNLIPTNAAEFVGNRQNELLSSLNS